jgi:hypothetical protein
LSRGFDTAEFDLRVSSDEGLAFEWEAPSKAQRVICALFVGDPEVARSGGVSDERLGRIANADQTLHRYHVFPMSSNGGSEQRVVSFTLNDLSTVNVPTSCSGFQPFALGLSYPVVTSLLVGCWAYDRERVIGATQLRNVRLADLNEVKPPLSECGAALDGEAEGRFCVLPAQLGECRDRMCQPVANPTAVDSMQDAGAGAMSTGGDGGTAEAPVRSCTEALEGKSCWRDPDRTFGRCIGNRCVDRSLEELPLPLVVSDCGLQGSATNKMNCFDAVTQSYGTCASQACRYRCVTDEDCDAATELLGSSEDLRCSKYNRYGELVCAAGGVQARELSYLGLCLPSEVSGCN